MNEQCIICNRTAEKYEDANIKDALFYDCASCGVFGVIGRVQSSLSNESKEVLFKLACLMAENRVKNRGRILFTNIHEDTYDNYILIDYHKWVKNFPNTALEILERSLLNIATQTNHPADEIFVEEDERELFFSKDINHLMYVMEQLADLDYVSSMSSINDNVQIQTKGWEKIEELRKKPAGNISQAFVAMWFNEKTIDFYDNGIEKAIEDDQKYKALRVDRLEHNNKICDQIIAEVKRSKFMIADFTGNRGGVYFEAGFAQGLGIPVIWLVHKDDIDNLHFDTRQYNHIVYSSPKELYVKLKSRIAATID